MNVWPSTLSIFKSYLMDLIEKYNIKIITIRAVSVTSTCLRKLSVGPRTIPLLLHENMGWNMYERSPKRIWDTGRTSKKYDRTFCKILR